MTDFVNGVLVKKTQSLTVPRRTRKPHSDYQAGGRRDPATSGKASGFMSLREHQEHLHFTKYRKLDRQLARDLGYPEDEILGWFGPE